MNAQCAQLIDALYAYEIIVILTIDYTSWELAYT